MLIPPSAVERAMQIKEVLLRAMNKEYSWLRAADILGITPRGLRRLRQRMEEFGYQGLVDMRRGRPSPRRTPVAEVERILELYRERYSGFNARHFSGRYGESTG
jgi:molybdenum-dependent DNA-binding transcriptional regulator ModE